MLSLEIAQQQILAAVPVAPPESISVSAAHRRVLAQTIHSAIDLPAFDNSAVDGYAVHAADVTTARADLPVSLRVVTQIAAGSAWAGSIQRGECARIFTGSAMPAGADAVVMQEDVRTPAGARAVVDTLDSVKPLENVRLRGVDVRRDEQIGTSGSNINAGMLALLAATGMATVGVGGRPRIAMLATGSELCEAGTPLAAGQIYESNRAMLAALTTAAGGVTEVSPIVRDTLADTASALEQAFTRSDFVVTSGGVSVGELDFVKSAFAALGGKTEFWRVAIRPGKPFLFGQLENKFLFGLPGNPVSAFVTFLLLVRPAILRWQGAKHLFLREQAAHLAEPVQNLGDRRHFVRVRVNASGEVRKTDLQQSHALKSLAEANGLLDVTAGDTLQTGHPVSVLRWENE
jgi:molybdopterin molybdotransferase